MTEKLVSEKTSSNFQFNLPKYHETADIAIINYNFEKIDNILQNFKDTNNVTKENLTKLEESIKVLKENIDNIDLTYLEEEIQNLKENSSSLEKIESIEEEIHEISNQYESIYKDKANINHKHLYMDIFSHPQSENTLYDDIVDIEKKLSNTVSSKVFSQTIDNLGKQISKKENTLESSQKRRISISNKEPENFELREGDLWLVVENE